MSNFGFCGEVRKLFVEVNAWVDMLGMGSQSQHSIIFPRTENRQMELNILSKMGGQKSLAERHINALSLLWLSGSSLRAGFF